ncbi:uncharacterized protein LOC124419444 isoform X1 [Lucilia cuprina]|uniref:uncharacterized protein LOC124419444 isoform X1 n=1 Tax=Lucilia cuprina TaxID=7375 RepID=UPI001F057216|nr:uncharacterized protein LOC124419444 isoform X1 [Lucilia cuprina]
MFKTSIIGFKCWTLKKRWPHWPAAKKYTIINILEYIYTPRGTPLVILDNYLYRNNRKNYWRCFRFLKFSCKARLIIDAFGLIKTAGIHTHEREYEKINCGKKLLKSWSNSAENLYKLPNIPTKACKQDVRRKKVKKLPQHDQQQQQQEYAQQEELQIKKEDPDDECIAHLLPQ